jgi:hypothetical protein
MESLQFMEFNTTSDDVPLTPYFDLVGYNSMNSVTNLGSTFYYVIGNSLLLCLVGVTKWLGPQRLHNWLAEKTLWNYFIRFVMQQYVTLYISSLINFYSGTALEYSGDITALCFSVGLVAGCVMAPFIMQQIVKKKMEG